MSYSAPIALLALSSLSPSAHSAQAHDTGSTSADVKLVPRALAPALELDENSVETPMTPARAARDLGDSAQATRFDRDRLYFDVDASGTVWVRGRTYKAAFSSDSASYVPFLGSRAPRNFPVDLRIDAVTIGGEALAFDASVPAVRRGDTIEYARGPFVERYVLTPDSVEQTFVFDELPRRGEVVVALRIVSELAGSSDADGFLFGNELGHVRYGRAAAYHDELAPTPIESRLDGSRIEIRAPAALVESAVGRFVIDPVITTFAVENGTIDEFAADTAYDLSNAVWLTVSEEVFSASDHDVHAVRHSTAGTVTASSYVDFTGTFWAAPVVANNNLDDQFLVVAARGDAPNRAIWGRTVEATVSLNLSAQFEISDSGLTGDFYAPDVGGDPVAQAPAYYAVVWEREYVAGYDYDVHARLVRTDATLVGGGTILIDNSAVTIDTNPSISNSNGNATSALQDWNIVWQREIAAGNRNVLGARLHWDGTLTEPTFTIASSSFDEINPSVTSIVDNNGGTRPWMVAFQLETTSNGWDVRCRTLNNTSIISTFDLSEQFPSVALEQINPSCDTDGEQFVVAYDERSGPFFLSTDIKVSTLYSLGGALGVNEGNVSVSPGLEIDLRPRITAAASSGSVLDDAMVVFDRDDSGPNDVYATGYDLPNGGPVTVYCFGDGSGTGCPCGNAGAAGNGCASSLNAAGAHLGASGAADLSADTLQLVATGLPASAPVLFFQGTTQTSGGAGSVFGDGLRCASGTVIRLATKTASAGTASYPTGADLDVSVRGVVPAAGAVRYYQGWYRNSAPFCTASTFNLTNGLRVQWIP